MTALLHGAANLTQRRAGRGGRSVRRLCREPRADAARHADAPRRGRRDRRRPARRICKQAARDVWDDVLDSGRRHGFRNAQATVLAPTGTISFLMDCDTTGIEPDIALVKYKQLAGGGMLKIVNQTVPLALKTLGYDQPQIESILAYIDREDTIEGARRPEGRAPAGVRLCLPAAQRHAFDRLAGPRADDGGRPAVPVRRDLQDGEHAARHDAGRHRRRLPRRLAAGAQGPGRLSRRLEGEPAAVDQHRGRQGGRQAKGRARAASGCPTPGKSVTHKFSIAGHEGYITVGLYDDGRPGELFITMAKEGSTIGGLMDCFGTAVSMSLQYGVPLEVYVSKFSHTRFEPMGHTKNPDIRIAKSIVDYIFRWLGITFLPGYREAMLGHAADGRSGPHRPRRTPEAEPKLAATRAGEPTSLATDRLPRPTAKVDRPSRAKPAKKPGSKRLERLAAGTGRRDASRSQRRQLCHPGRAVRQLPDRCPQLRQLRRDHGPQRQLLSVPQLRQQHGLLVKD